MTYPNKCAIIVVRGWLPGVRALPARVSMAQIITPIRKVRGYFFGLPVLHFSQFTPSPPHRWRPCAAPFFFMVYFPKNVNHHLSEKCCSQIYLIYRQNSGVTTPLFVVLKQTGPAPPAHHSGLTQQNLCYFVAFDAFKDSNTITKGVSRLCHIACSPS